MRGLTVLPPIIMQGRSGRFHRFRKLYMFVWRAYLSLYIVREWGIFIQMGNGGCSVNSGARAPAPARRPRKQMSSPHNC